MNSSIAGNVTFQSGGVVTFRGGVVLPSGVVGNDQVSVVSPIAAAKLVHQYVALVAQPHGTAATAERRVVHVARSPGSIEQIRAGVVVAAAGDSTVTVDVLANGTTVLSSPMVIDQSLAAYGIVTGAISASDYLAGKVIEVVITVTPATGTLPQGVWAQVIVREGA